MDTRKRVENRAQRIKRLRLEKGLTLEQVGIKVGARKAAVSKWEKNPDINIELQKFFALADLLTIDPRELLTGEPTPAALPHKRLSLIRAYGRMPQELRQPIRMLIETVDAAATDNYAEWSSKRRVEAEARDKPRPEREKS